MPWSTTRPHRPPFHLWAQHQPLVKALCFLFLPRSKPKGAHSSALMNLSTFLTILHNRRCSNRSPAHHPVCLISGDPVHLSAHWLVSTWPLQVCFEKDKRCMSSPLNSQCTEWALSKNLGNGKFPKGEGECEGETRKQHRRQVCGAQSSLPSEPLSPQRQSAAVLFSTTTCHLVRLPSPTRRRFCNEDSLVWGRNKVPPL